MKEKIPFRHVQWTVLIKLANKLDPDSSIVGNNWRMLAEKLGYSIQDILVSHRGLFSWGLVVCLLVKSISLILSLNALCDYLVLP